MALIRFFQLDIASSSSFFDESKNHTHKKGQYHNSGTGQNPHKEGHSPCEFAVDYISFKFRLNSKPSVFFELSKSQHPAHTEKHKLIRDYRSLQGGKHRPQHGGFFTPVSCTQPVLSGVHRIQQAQAEYMHRFLEATITPAYFVQIIENQGATTMQTALTTGGNRPQSAQPLRLPSFPVGQYPAIPEKYRNKTLYSSRLLSEQVFDFSTISFLSVGSSIMCMKDSELVAWIYSGHAGSRTNPNRCTFFDVAFPSLTFDPQNRITGVVLESDSFETLADAVRFIESTFASAEAEL